MEFICVHCELSSCTWETEFCSLGAFPSPKSKTQERMSVAVPSDLTDLPTRLHNGSTDLPPPPVAAMRPRHRLVHDKYKEQSRHARRVAFDFEYWCVWSSIRAELRLTYCSLGCPMALVKPEPSSARWWEAAGIPKASVYPASCTTKLTWFLVY